MEATAVNPEDHQTHRIEIRVREVGQLFNTMDPSPFLEKDLDADAEEFILSWAQEFPLRDRLILVIHLAESPGQHPQPLIEKAIRHYFTDRAKLSRLELRRLMRDARTSLLIGASFLCGCLTLSGVLAATLSGTTQQIAREGLTITGWVAMWRPLQMYLYDWWPLHRRLKVFEKMSQISVEVHRDA